MKTPFRSRIGRAGILLILMGAVYIGAPQSEPMGAWSLLPPLIAIGGAFFLGEVIIALVMGVWIGVWLMEGASFVGFGGSFLQVFDNYLIPVLHDTSHLMVIVFSLFISGTVGVLKDCGSLSVMAALFRRWARTRRRAMASGYLLGGAVFFDDYANTLIVGNTMKGIFPRFRISREKLAYIVDSTSAPVAAIALVTTWIGAQLGYIDEALRQMPDITMGSYGIFLASLPYAFYPLLTLWMVGLLIYTQRDFGPMWDYERAAWTAKIEQDHFEESLTIRRREVVIAISPILILVLGTIVALWYTGSMVSEKGTGWRYVLEVFGNGDAYRGLLWSSAIAATVSMGLAVFYWKRTVQNAFASFFKGMGTMLPAVAILVSAWMLGKVIDELQTAQYIVSVMPHDLGIHWLPAIFFIMSAITSFSTGSSWGTMAIIYPIALPIVYVQGKTLGIPVEEIVPPLVHTASVVLAGSVFGDHCSPISDTTILSAMASDCELLSHVKTQLPYALTVGLVALIIGHVGVGAGLPWWVAWGLGAGVLGVIVRYWGHRIDDSMGGTGGGLGR